MKIELHGYVNEVYHDRELSTPRSPVGYVVVRVVGGGDLVLPYGEELAQALKEHRELTVTIEDRALAAPPKEEP